MSKFKRWAVMMGLLAMLIGCGGGLPLGGFPPTLNLEAYKATGELISRQTVGPQDQPYQRLKVLLENEPRGWSKSTVSYKSSPYVFRADRLIVRCYAELIVVDVIEDGRASSWQKAVPNLLSVLGLAPT